MPSRIATRVLQVGVIGASAAALVTIAVLHERGAMQERPASGAAPVDAGCPGWTAARLPELGMVDVAAPAPDDVWLLTTRGVYHWDGCTWAANEPSANLAGMLVDWETIVVDPDGALVVTGQSDAGPNRCHGCMCEPTFPSRRHSYRFVAGQPLWERIEARPRATPEQASDTRLDDERVIIAVDDTLQLGASGPRFAVVKRQQHIPSYDEEGALIGYGTTTSTELWRDDSGAWSSILGAPSRDDVPAPLRGSIFEPRPPELAGLPDDFAVTAFGGSGPSDLWVVGYRADVMPDILHFDGMRWTSHRFRFRRDVQYRFTAVTSTGPDDVWVVGSWGTVMHFDGLIWSVLDKPSFVDLVDVVAIPGAVIVRDGGGGVFYRTRSR